MQKRLFFGISVEAPWPISYPKGRVIDEQSRHMTLAFLGNHPEPDLSDFPRPEFTIGPAGKSDKVLFLPKMHPRVVAYHIDWLTGGGALETYQKKILDWLEAKGFTVDRRPFLPHLTIARSPFIEAEWESHFESLPMITTGIHLYESIGNLRYSTIWSLSLLSAFEEFEHTADIAFHVRGKDFNALYLHGACAMSFKFPQFLNFLEEGPIESMDQLIKRLGHMVARSDQEIGCPFKAVSHHGKLKKENNLYHWEMIVDV